MLIFSSSLFFKIDLFLCVKIHSLISVVVWEICATTYGSNCAKLGINTLFTAMCFPLSFTKMERKEECYKLVTMKKQGKYPDRGAEGIFAGLLHFLVLQRKLK